MPFTIAGPGGGGGQSSVILILLGKGSFLCFSIRGKIDPIGMICREIMAYGNIRVYVWKHHAFDGHAFYRRLLISLTEIHPFIKAVG